MSSEIAYSNTNTNTENENRNTGAGVDVNTNTNANANATANATAELNLPTVDEQRQYKIQLLLHINSILLARVIQMNNSLQNNLQNNINNSNNNNIIRIQQLISQFLKRVHANLQCISQINQGVPSAKPLILTPPQLANQQQPPQDILSKLYLLLARVFEIW
ncbi:AFH_G0009530.mRNA.1.CDS.1 [Saccharomyces cerevisiae]|nr:ALH_1c_G0009560.mRNA.1.CDS.1 [Saccharomyces cerevisiae]CAI4344085.1 ALH_1b_G0009590.mRNA.1.CDS.1 [Saccharomyces cerevisiae]CAI4872656.1 AFH_G0009530.mRNA.1.CDS.1 [Saccharomyces cerevisiae]CAI6553942.1 ALH_1c_G0009560.mRNA.1.CDS.1 [Saccharomyces cerevisiae]CAI6554167.1 AFH_G0009530.mRNA.1.CDS.1 [Saccharomyces cerevisiae]